MKTETQTPEQIDAQLDAATISQISFKPGPVTNISVAIVKHILSDRIVWMDDIELPQVDAADKNAIGLSIRRLANIGIITRMEGMNDHRRSKVKARRGGQVWKYRLANQKLAETFLKRNNCHVYRMPGELDLTTKP
jgi:predicted transcriptional regulator